MNKIYLVHPISGHEPEEVFQYYKETENRLKLAGYEVLTPMYGKRYLRCETKFRASDYTNPVSTNHAIMGRDNWMVHQSDIVYANFIGTKAVTIGGMMELAWSYDNHKHSVVSVEKGNVHAHAFVYEAADVVYEDHESAMLYLEELVRKEY